MKNPEGKPDFSGLSTLARMRAAGLVLGIIAPFGALVSACPGDAPAKSDTLQRVAELVTTKPCPIGTPVDLRGVTVAQIKNKSPYVFYQINNAPKPVTAFADRTELENNLDVAQPVRILGKLAIEPDQGKCAIDITSLANQAPPST